MSRKKVVREKKKHLLEPKFKDPLLSKFMRMLMWDGKLSMIEKNVYQALDKLAEQYKTTNTNPLEIFHIAVANAKPKLKVKSRRIGGSNYQVPIEVPEQLGYALAMRWIISAIRKLSGMNLADKLKRIIAETYENRGDAVRKKEDTHRMADANRAFAHFRV